jgi:hypothetical protein
LRRFGQLALLVLEAGGKWLPARTCLAYESRIQ